MTPQRGWRSLLFVAADDRQRLDKAGTRGADALILDLEDAVPPAAKAGARASLAATVDRLAGSGADIVIRINAGWLEALEDLDAAIRPGVSAIMVPKADDAARLRAISGIAGEHAAARSLPPPGLVALVEGADALNLLADLAAVPGLSGLALGSEDFALSMGVAPTPELLDLPCRLVALAAAARGLIALGAPVSIATIADSDAWSAGLDRARAIGMSGALCVHPAQVAAANDAFSPSADEVASAERIVRAWRGMAAGGAVLVDGRMVDLPVAWMAARLVGVDL